MSWTEENSQKFDVAQSLILAHVASKEGLKKLGILRTERPIQSDYGEWLAANAYGLTLAASTVQKGWDATDSQEKRYQIKTRFVSDLNTSTSFDFSSDEFSFDYLVGIFLSVSYELLGIIRVPRETVEQNSSKTERSWRFRWNRTTIDNVTIEWAYPKKQQNSSEILL